MSISRNLASLQLVETATLGHFLTDGFMPPEIQCVLDNVTVCGPALTVSLPGNDGSSLLKGIVQSNPGDILVIERVDDNKHACWGEVMTVAAQQMQITAVILDGFITDVNSIREAGFPIWCKGRSPITTKSGGQNGSVNKSIVCGGVKINPGDIVLADENGVVALDPITLEEVILKALDIQSKEPSIIQRLKQGEMLDIIYGLDT